MHPTNVAINYTAPGPQGAGGFMIVGGGEGAAIGVGSWVGTPGAPKPGYPPNTTWAVGAYTRIA